MPNIASTLKQEIGRIARKQTRAEIAALKKAVSMYRSEIAALKRRAGDLEQQLRRVRKSRATVRPAQQDNEADATFRFSPKGLASHRERLGLSANDMGKLLGASGQSVYKWENGDARPRARNMPGIAAVRSLGRRDVARILANLERKP
jgi:DNA-binding transcriptional regulator YiaG